MKIVTNGEYLFQNNCNCKIFVKCMVKEVKLEPLYEVIFQSSSNCFEVMYDDQTAIETSTFPAICIFKRLNLIL